MLMVLPLCVTGHPIGCAVSGALKNAIDRTSGSSGFPVVGARPYYLEPRPLGTTSFILQQGRSKLAGSGPTQAQIDS